MNPRRDYDFQPRRSTSSQIQQSESSEELSHSSSQHYLPYKSLLRSSNPTPPHISTAASSIGHQKLVTDYQDRNPSRQVAIQETQLYGDDQIRHWQFQTTALMAQIHSPRSFGAHNTGFDDYQSHYNQQYQDFRFRTFTPSSTHDVMYEQQRRLDQGLPQRPYNADGSLVDQCLRPL